MAYEEDEEDIGELQGIGKHVKESSIMNVECASRASEPTFEFLQTPKACLRVVRIFRDSSGSGELRFLGGWGETR